MTVTVLSKANFLKVLSTMEDKGKTPSQKKDTFYISILDPDVREPLYQDSDNYKTFWFYDFEEPVGSYMPMSQKQGEDIVDFILQNKDKTHCVVHCTYGISRSGAVGDFVNDLFGDNYHVFKQRNRQISPNVHVKMLLNKHFRENVVTNKSS